MPIPTPYPDPVSSQFSMFLKTTEMFHGIVLMGEWYCLQQCEDQAKGKTESQRQGILLAACMNDVCSTHGAGWLYIWEGVGGKTSMQEYLRNTPRQNFYSFSKHMYVLTD